MGLTVWLINGEIHLVDDEDDTFENEPLGDSSVDAVLANYGYMRTSQWRKPDEDSDIVVADMQALPRPTNPQPDLTDDLEALEDYIDEMEIDTTET